jgi:tetratricopeptide (TPR) repeat protein
MAANGAARYEQAAQAFLRAHAVARNATALFNAAAMYAKLNRADDSFRWLDSSISLNPFAPQQLEQDADFATLRNDPRYAKALDRTRRAVTPCMYDPNYRRLDFWIGEWDVKNVAGGQAGQSVVESIAGGCALLENWIPGAGRPGGKSLNTWHPQLKQLQQYWVGGGGGVTEYRKGTWTDTSVVYTGDITGANGEPVVLRLTFAALKDGRVRQWAEQSISGGAWTTQYDFYYVRRK